MHVVQPEATVGSDYVTNYVDYAGYVVGCDLVKKLCLNNNKTHCAKCRVPDAPTVTTAEDKSSYNLQH